jgi:hypothetical protein
MICPICQGARVVWRGYHAEPCPECGGCGVAHCCDGHQPSAHDGAVEIAAGCESAAGPRTEAGAGSRGINRPSEAKGASQRRSAAHRAPPVEW